MNKKGTIYGKPVKFVFIVSEQGQVIEYAPMIYAKWIDSKRTPHSQCSACEEWVDIKKKSNYCPNCGANMRERKR